MEDLDQINTGLSTIRQIVPLFRSLLQKAPTEGASEEFTRQLNDAVINMQQAVIDAQEMVLAGQATEAKLRSRVQELETTGGTRGQVGRRDFALQIGGSRS